MIVQINRSKNGETTVCMVAQDVAEQVDLKFLAEALQKRPFLSRESHAWTPNGADNVLLVTSKGNASRRS